MQWIQIATISAFRGANPGYSNEWLFRNTGFDGEDFNVKYTDSPKIEGNIVRHNDIWMGIKCDNWMMFKADGDDSIPVPYKMVHWEWNGRASGILLWHIDESYTSRTTDDPVETTIFPEWTRKVSIFPSP